MAFVHATTHVSSWPKKLLDRIERYFKETIFQRYLKDIQRYSYKTDHTYTCKADENSNHYYIEIEVLKPVDSNILLVIFLHINSIKNALRYHFNLATGELFPIHMREPEEKPATLDYISANTRRGLIENIILKTKDTYSQAGLGRKFHVSPATIGKDLKILRERLKIPEFIPCDISCLRGYLKNPQEFKMRYERSVEAVKQETKYFEDILDRASISSIMKEEENRGVLAFGCTWTQKPNIEY